MELVDDVLGTVKFPAVGIVPLVIAILVVPLDFIQQVAVVSS